MHFVRFASAKARFSRILLCFRRSGVFTYVLTIRQQTYFSCLTHEMYDVLRFFVPSLLVFYSVFTTFTVFRSEFSTFAKTRVSSAAHVHFVCFASAKARITRIL